MTIEYSRINKEFPIDRLYRCQRKKSQSHTEVMFGWYLVRLSNNLVGNDGEIVFKKGSWLIQQNWWSYCTRATKLKSFREAQKDFWIPKKSMSKTAIADHQNNGSDF